MLRRTLTALALGAVALPAIIYGGWFYFLLVGVLLVGGAWEYIRMYRAVQVEPNQIVTVGGVLFPPDALTVPTGTASPVERITKVDLGQIGAQLPYPILPIYLLLQTQQPPQRGSLPEPPPLPPLTNGPHLSYAFQWFSFATIAIVGCIVLLRRDRRDEVAAVAPHRGEEV